MWPSLFTVTLQVSDEFPNFLKTYLTVHVFHDYTSPSLPEVRHGKYLC